MHWFDEHLFIYVCLCASRERITRVDAAKNANECVRKCIVILTVQEVMTPFFSPMKKDEKKQHTDADRLLFEKASAESSPAVFWLVESDARWFIESRSLFLKKCFRFEIPIGRVVWANDIYWSSVRSKWSSIVLSPLRLHYISLQPGRLLEKVNVSVSNLTNSIVRPDHSCDLSIDKTLFSSCQHFPRYVQLGVRWTFSRSIV